MTIDGRDIARRDGTGEPSSPAPATAKRDAYESPAVRLISQAIVWVPLALVVWFAYVSGTWLGGGWIAGVLSVVSTVFTFGVLWLWYRMRRRRRGTPLR